MKVRLSTSGSGTRWVAYIERDGEWKPIVGFEIGGPSDYEIYDTGEITKREMAAVTLAVACEAARSDRRAKEEPNFDETPPDPL